MSGRARMAWERGRGRWLVDGRTIVQDFSGSGIAAVRSPSGVSRGRRPMGRAGPPHVDRAPWWRRFISHGRPRAPGIPRPPGLLWCRALRSVPGGANQSTCFRSSWIADQFAQPTPCTSVSDMSAVAISDQRIGGPVHTPAPGPRGMAGLRRSGQLPDLVDG